MSDTAGHTLDVAALTGRRRGPYRSFNPVSRVQIWQWCSAMGDRNPLYLDSDYHSATGIERAVAPPAMMQMWTMRDVNMQLAPGSSAEPAYEVFDVMAAQGFPANVAVSYDLQFHHLLQEGDRAYHYTSIAKISELKQTAIGRGYFVTEHSEFFDQNDAMYAEALITYFQYQPAAGEDNAAQHDKARSAPVPAQPRWQPDYQNLRAEDVAVGQNLPELPIAITHKLIVSGALASQDFIDVHHNAPAAVAAGMPDIFMNILTTCGLSARYLTDWAGPGSRIRRLSFKLLAPNTPGDTMLMRGRVSALQANDDSEPNAVVVDFAGENGRGFHVTGQATLTLAD